MLSFDFYSLGVSNDSTVRCLVEVSITSACRALKLTSRLLEAKKIERSFYFNNTVNNMRIKRLITIHVQHLFLYEGFMPSVTVNKKPKAEVPPKILFEGSSKHPHHELCPTSSPQDCHTASPS